MLGLASLQPAAAPPSGLLAGMCLDADACAPAKNASGKNFCKTRRRRRNFYPQPVTEPQKNTPVYDQHASEPTIYAYTGGNPVRFVDPNGNDAVTQTFGRIVSGGGGDIIGPVVEFCTTTPAGWIVCGTAATIGTIYGVHKLYKECTANNSSNQSTVPATSQSSNPNNACSPPKGTVCWEEHTSHTHNGWNPHYHIWTMNQIPSTGKCYWRKGNGPGGTKGSPPSGQSCSNYPSWIDQTGNP